MSAETQHVELLCVDEKGRPSKTLLQFPKTRTVAQVQTSLDALHPLIAPISGIGVRGANLVIPMTWANISPQAGTGTNTSMDKALFEYVDADGNKGKFTLSAPLVTIMNSNDFTINDTNADILNFVTWVTTNLQSPYGKAITGVIDMYRTWRNRKSKNT